MSTKMLILVLIMFNLYFPIKSIAQENMAGAEELQNISSPNGLEGIVIETEGKNSPENTYQIQKKESNSDSIFNTDQETIIENDDHKGEKEPPVVKIKL